MRLDVWLADQYKISRNKAQFAIDEEKVKVNGIIVKKSGYQVEEKDRVELISQDEIHYVARSAFKLK
jgi:predicted rRNA methylase YqxC with S4 and FtsJ domains